MPSIAWTLVADGREGLVGRGGGEHDQVDLVGAMPAAASARAPRRRQASRSSRRRRRYGGCGCRCARRSIRRWCRRSRASSALVDAPRGQRRSGADDDRAHASLGGLVGRTAWARKLSRSSAIFRVMSLRTMLAATRDRVGDALGVGAAMALHHQAVEAEEDRAVMVVGIEMDLAAGRAPGARSGSRSSSGASW